MVSSLSIGVLLVRCSRGEGKEGRGCLSENNICDPSNKNVDRAREIVEQLKACTALAEV